MKFSTPLAAVFVAAMALSACGGGSSAAPVTVNSPASLSTVEIAIGTGAAATTGATATVNYTGWLYKASAPDFKGDKFNAGSFSFKLGANQVVPGFEQGVIGMKVNGKRTIIIPASLGYGAAGNAAAGIPPNTGLVFDVELTAVQ